MLRQTRQYRHSGNGGILATPGTGLTRCITFLIGIGKDLLFKVFRKTTFPFSARLRIPLELTERRNEISGVVFSVANPRDATPYY